MKNRYIKIFLIVLIALLTSFCFNKVIEVSADSGWDTSYDSGGGWDSGSDQDYWSSNDDYDSSSYSSHDSNYTSGSSCKTEECKRKNLLIVIIIFVTAFVVLIGLIILSIVLTRKSKNIKANHKNIFKDYEKISIHHANLVIPGFNIRRFNKKAYQIFYDVQMGWMEFDYDKLKSLLSDELYNTYLMDLEALKVKNQKNIMEQFEQIKTVLIDIKKENNRYVVKVALEVKFIDYIEDSNTHKVLRGSNKHKVDNTYILTFEKSIDENQKNICPNCGAKVEGNTTGICEYCKSKLVNETYDWVLVKKEIISQK